MPRKKKGFELPDVKHAARGQWEDIFARFNITVPKKILMDLVRTVVARIVFDLMINMKMVIGFVMFVRKAKTEMALI